MSSNIQEDSPPPGHPEDQPEPAENAATEEQPEQLAPSSAADGDAIPDPDEADPDVLRAQRDEYVVRLQRSRADYQNQRRRALTDIENGVRRALGPLLEDILLVLDHMDMALQSSVESPDAVSLATGVRMTREQLVRALEEHGVQAVPEGGAFDPNLHQAVASVESEEVEAGSIIDTVRRGFTWRHGVLRHAQVRVAREPSAQVEAGEEPKTEADSDG